MLFFFYIFQVVMMYYVVIIGLMCISFSYCMFTSENVVFQKTNEIYFNDALVCDICP